MNLIHPWQGPEDEEPSEEFRNEQRTIVIVLMIIITLGLIGMHYANFFFWKST